jgi:hypothetical protein
LRPGIAETGAGAFDSTPFLSLTSDERLFVNGLRAVPGIHYTPGDTFVWNAGVLPGLTGNLFMKTDLPAQNSAYSSMDFYGTGRFFVNGSTFFINGERREPFEFVTFSSSCSIFSGVNIHVPVYDSVQNFILT